jgi:hypothetical protein
VADKGNSMDEPKLIIHLDEFIKQKARKEEELEYYGKQLETLQLRMNFIKQEIDLTNNIIKIIEKDTVVELKK